MTKRRSILLVQLPIPPLGPEPIRGNVPLAAGYLKLLARQRGLEAFYNIDLFPPSLANTVGDQALVASIVERRPWLVGFTGYLWNVERTLWIAERVKRALPDVRVVLGGPEITQDNAWVLGSPAIDYAVIGEGEQTFADLLLALFEEEAPPVTIPGLYDRASGQPVTARKPLANLDVVSSPYLAGILDAADEGLLLLETIRGCVFKCKFCYYPKSYDALYFVSEERIVANLRHAAEHGATEVVLLDPTLNQRRDFSDFLRLLARCNPDRQFTYFGELRGEGITATTAKLLRDANFTEVEIGLQSIDPHVQELMDRKNNLRAFERGARAMLDEGIKVKVDLIIGLPGDTVETVRQSMEYLRESGLYTDVQVFNLSVLPGTAFRQEAGQLGLRHQPRPPYYVLDTPTLRREDLFMLMEEARDVFGMEWDPMPPVVLPERRASEECAFIDLDQPFALPAGQHRQCFTLWFTGNAIAARLPSLQSLVARTLEANPFTTLQIVLEPKDDPQKMTPNLLRALLATCHRDPSYLDRYYALQPGRPMGAKRLVVVVEEEKSLDPSWRASVEELATLVTPAGAPVASREGLLEPACTSL